MHYIHHITLNTGHVARTPRAEVSEVAMAAMVQWLDRALDSPGERVALPVPKLAEFGAIALTEGGALVVTIYGPSGAVDRGMPYAAKPQPLITFAVARRSRQGAAAWRSLNQMAGTTGNQPPEPWCAVVLHPQLAMYIGATQWIADLERCIAWAWLTRNPDLRSVS